MPIPETQFCTECGKPRPVDDLLQFEGRSVCQACKPAFAQRLRQEGVAPTTLRGLDYGGFWIRFAARLIDGIILGVAVLAANALIMLAFRQSAGSGNSLRVVGPLVTALIFAVNIVIAVGYEAFFLVRSAATPGKMVLGLKVINVNGTPISWGKAIARFLCYYVDNLTLMIGYIIAAFDAEKRALHDHICGTRVIRQSATQPLLSTQV